ncbi:Hypothetical protein R9X50_00749000 [Acrodontium crateriforme]|uniref:Uncharacterized protein n=1 Tax=Acrodontium crateriforme TaxID=150365 RepID=A0AAQ3MCG0_9PEZI|nr:Hypothetical protein R9X50_00749000 [Acrodontium crateriforme]
MAFVFVDNNHQIDATRRKAIRSHVMKGKNAGKERPLGSHQKRAEDKAAKSRTQSHQLAIATEFVVSIHRPLGNDMAYVSFPSQLSTSSMGNICRWIHFAGQGCYPLASCFPHNPSEASWLPFMQSNEAFFHCILAISASFSDDMTGLAEASPKTLQHFSDAYRSINQNLQQTRIPADSTVTVVTALTIHEDLRRENFASRIHLDALEKMVKMRGGIDAFDNNQFLLNKICRADIEHAIHSCSNPRFYRDKFPYDAIGGYPSPSRSCLDAEVESPFNQIYDDFMTTCTRLNSNSTLPSMDSAAYQEMLISICYRLLRHYPLSTGSSHNYRTNNEGAYCLGMIALLSTLLFQRGIPYQLSYQTIKNRLRNVILGNNDKTPLPDEVLLWVLFVSCISVFGPEDLPSLLPELKGCLQRCNVDSWPRVHQIIKPFPWIGVIHDEPGRKLWKLTIWT